MKVIIRKLTSFFFPTYFVRASQEDHDRVVLTNKKSFDLLEKYDKGEVEIDYSAELKKLKKFAKAN